MGGIIMNFFTPAEVAKNYIATGKSKVNTPIPKMIILAILAGAFIGFGGVGATTVAVSITEPSLGKFIGACVFPVLVRRDTREKVVVSLDEVETKVPELLETIQKDMFERAKAHRDAHITDAHNYEEFCDAVENKPGFIRGMWCGDRACEDKIKEDLAVTSRCMPFNDQEHISDVCVCCGKPAHKLVYWGKAY